MTRIALLPFALLPALVVALWFGPGDDRRIGEHIAAVDRSVVRVLVESPSGRTTGSGLVINRNGVIVTNNHVVMRATGPDWNVSVTSGGDALARPARILAAFPGEDLALLQVEGLAMPPVTFAAADAVLPAKGGAVAVLGYPGAADRLGPGGVPILTEQIQGVFYASGIAPLIDRLRAAGIGYRIAPEVCAMGAPWIGRAAFAGLLGLAGLARSPSSRRAG